MTDCDTIRIELGSYALGALEPDEARHIKTHLDHCDRCQTELAELSAASDLLRSPTTRAFAAELERGPDLDPAMVADALARVAATRSSEARRTRQLRTGRAAAGTGFVAAIAIAFGLTTRPADPFAPTSAATTLQAAPGITAAATIRLSARPWGTQVDLRTSQLPPLPPGSYYQVWLVRPDGTRVAAGTFRPTTPDGRARVRLAAAIPRPQVARIGITIEAGGDSTRILDATT